MTLTNRLWHAIAYRFKYRTAEEEITTWVKIKAHAKGKRHALIAIPLNDRETAAVRTLFAECDDDYFRFALAHEREHNPGYSDAAHETLAG